MLIDQKNRDNLLADLKTNLSGGSYFERPRASACSGSFGRRSRVVWGSLGVCAGVVQMCCGQMGLPPQQKYIAKMGPQHCGPHLLECSQLVRGWSNGVGWSFEGRWAVARLLTLRRTPPKHPCCIEITMLARRFSKLIFLKLNINKSSLVRYNPSWVAP